MTVSSATKARYVPGTSRGPRNVHTLAMQMAMEQERQLEVAERIRQLRGPKPQPVIAEEVGVGLRAYQHWEAGGGISWENLQKLADVFGVTENYLLYGEGQPVGPETQLDRIEKALQEVLSLLRDPEAEIERETAEEDEQDAEHDANNAASDRKKHRRDKAP